MKKKISIIILVALVAIQFIPIEKNKSNETNNENDFIAINQLANERIGKTIKSACYDCHSNNTVYPWYDNIAPVSWFVARHVNEGTQHLNFSEWGTYEIKKKNHKIEECIEFLESREMPLKTYKILHPEARLSNEEYENLITYFKNL